MIGTGDEVERPVAAAEAAVAIEQLKQQRKKSSGSSLGVNVLTFVSVLVAFIAAMYAWNKDKPKEGGMFSGGPAPGLQAAGAGEPAGSAGGPAIVGTIDLAPSIADRASAEGTLFIVVRNAGMPVQGIPPVAVRRFNRPQFPLRFEISKAHVMVPSTPFEGPFDISVRLDRDGNAMTKDRGDLAMSTPAKAVTLGGPALSLILDHVTGENAAPTQVPEDKGELAAAGGRISGEIAVAESLGGSIAASGAIFIVLRNAGMPPVGPPVAVRRYPTGTFPLAFDLGAENVMMQGMPFAGPFDIYVRWDGDGNAMTKNQGDLEMSEPVKSVKVGTSGVRIVLDTRRP